MSRYSVYAPTSDRTVLALRAELVQARSVADSLESRLEELMPTPVCKKCNTNLVQGTFDWTLCGPCWNGISGERRK